MAKLKREPKKGPYRKVERVEILKDTKARKAGVVCEMHPVLAKRLIAADKAKTSTKKLTPVVHVGTPTAKDDETEE